jgi:hypothetical protein
MMMASPTMNPTRGEIQIQVESAMTKVIMMQTSRPVVAMTVAMPAE